MLTGARVGTESSPVNIGVGAASAPVGGRQHKILEKHPSGSRLVLQAAPLGEGHVLCAAAQNLEVDTEVPRGFSTTKQ